MGVGGRDGFSEIRRDFEQQPFFLIPLVEHSMTSMLDDYIDVILSNIGEEGGKKNFYTYLSGFKNYKQSPKNACLREIFTGFFESFGALKGTLKREGLEKTANSIEMGAPDSSGFGTIEYQRAFRTKGEFADYRLIKKEELLAIINWGLKII